MTPDDDSGIPASRAPAGWSAEGWPTTNGLQDLAPIASPKVSGWVAENGFSAPAHLIFDRDAIFSAAVVRFVQALDANPRRIAYRSPWQNPVAER